MDETSLRLLRYVARHYGELQGLTDMAMATIAGTAAAWTLAFGFHWGVATVAVICAIPAGLLTNRYYAVRFGRVRAGVTGNWMQRWPVLYAAIVGGCLLWDEHHVGSGLPSVTLLLWSAAALWRVITGWPFLMHWLVVFGASLLASTMFMFVESGVRLGEWLATTVCLISIALFASGWCDHRLLVRALENAPASSGEHATHDRGI